MPSVSKDDAATKVRWDGVDIDHANLEGGYGVCFEGTPPTPTSPRSSVVFPKTVHSFPAGAM